MTRRDRNDPAAPAIETTLIQLALWVRVLGFIWMTLLVIVTWLTDDGANRLVVAGAELLAGVWTYITVRSARNPLSMRSWQFAVADGIVALLVASASYVSGAGELFHGGYPISWLAVAAYAGGMRYSVTAALALGSQQVVGHVLTDRSLVATTGALVFLVFAVIFGWTIDTLRRNDARRSEAERALEAERTERALEAERLALANELHDSILQTLQVIRTDADNPSRVRYLVRSEERAIDRMISRYRRPEDGGFEEALLTVRDEVEDLHGTEIRIVIRDDTPMTPAVEAAIAATREALSNASRHSGSPIINLYAEAHDGHVHIFVRDRGAGFDPTEVIEGRGLRHSLRERMATAGGSVAITSSVGEGTEVEICSGVCS
ncbi:MAG: ATP-binding protein [Actinomycetota bacterium]